MSKQIYISADYSNDYGDRNVVDTLNKWGNDNLRSINFIDMSKVASGSVSRDNDCRACDLKAEFNRQINASSAVIFVVGDKTASRDAGSICSKTKENQIFYPCTPYKQNSNGNKWCKRAYASYYEHQEDVYEINTYSYLRHEFEQAKKRNKLIVIVYNSTRYETKWLPSYMKGYENSAFPFWKMNAMGEKIGNYDTLKEVLGNV